MSNLYNKFTELSIPYVLLEHKPVTTMAEGAEIVDKLKKEGRGNVCINLLTTNKKKTVLYLIVALPEKLKINSIGKQVGTKLKMVKQDEMESILNVSKGGATIFAIQNDNEHKIKILISDKIPKDENVCFHPLRNDATVSITYQDLIKYIKHYGNEIIYFDKGTNVTTKTMNIVTKKKKVEQVVTPWDTKCGDEGFNYDKLINQFGCQKLTPELLERFEKVTGHVPHFWMKRGIFFAHRQLDEILDDHEKGIPIFLYTGRGPTSDMHVGHALAFTLTKWLQDVFNAIVVIQMADDEKYYFKDIKFEDTYNLGFKNAKDIVSFGFNPEKTFIFSNRDYLSTPSYNFIFSEMFKRVKISTVKAIFGITDNKCVGQIVWPVYQSAAAFSQVFEHIFGKKNYRCLVLYAIDQDPYFRMCRDVAPKLKFYKPCSIIGKFIPALEGDAKLSSTGKNATIFLTDSEKDIRKKIMKHAFSGGQVTLAKHRELGGNTKKDISYQWLRFFEEDDQKLEKIKKDFESGALTSGEIKKIMADKVVKFIHKIEQVRNTVTDEYVKSFYEHKALKLD